jgi:two-component system response regulator RegA
MTGGERRPSVLLAEDDPVFSEVLAGALSRRGFEVMVAMTCAEAKRLLAGSRPDFAVVDLRIGQDSGLSLIPALVAPPKPVRTVVLTGYGSIATAVEAIKLGAVQYLTKPVQVEELLAALQATSAAEHAPVSTLPLSVKRLEWEHIQRVLNDNNGNISATARALGIHRRTLQRKLNKHPVRR